MANKKTEVKKESKLEVPVYNPQKQYTWQADDKFIFTGGELGTLNTVLSEFLGGNGNHIQHIFAISQLHNLIQNKIKAYVELGAIKEAPQEVKPIETLA